MNQEQFIQSLSSRMPMSPREGLHDLWGLFRRGEDLAELIEMLVHPFVGIGVTKIVGVEARGFLLGGMAAIKLGVGFVPVRKAGGYHPGPKYIQRSCPDWSGKVNLFELQTVSLSANDRVAFVDDWYTTGSQAEAAIQLVIRAGAQFVGASVVAEEGDPHLNSIPFLNALLRWSPGEQQFSVSPFNPFFKERSCSSTSIRTASVRSLDASHHGERLQ